MNNAVKKAILLSAVLVLTGCSLTADQKRELAREQVRARLLLRELGQWSEQQRRYAAERLQQMEGLRVIVRDQVGLAERALAYRREIKRLIEQARKGPLDRGRVQTISGELDQLMAQILERTQEQEQLIQRAMETKRQIAESDLTSLRQEIDRLPAWAVAATASEWSLQRGREVVLEAGLLMERAQRVEREIEQWVEQLGAIQRKLKQEPLPELMQELEQLSA